MQDYNNNNIMTPLYDYNIYRMHFTCVFYIICCVFNVIHNYFPTVSCFPNNLFVFIVNIQYSSVYLSFYIKKKKYVHHIPFAPIVSINFRVYMQYASTYVNEILFNLIKHIKFAITKIININ